MYVCIYIYIYVYVYIYIYIYIYIMFRSNIILACFPPTTKTAVNKQETEKHNIKNNSTTTIII